MVLILIFEIVVCHFLRTAAGGIVELGAYVSSILLMMRKLGRRPCCRLSRVEVRVRDLGTCLIKLTRVIVVVVRLVCRCSWLLNDAAFELRDVNRGAIQLT